MVEPTDFEATNWRVMLVGLGTVFGTAVLSNLVLLVLSFLIEMALFYTGGSHSLSDGLGTILGFLAMSGIVSGMLGAAAGALLLPPALLLFRPVYQGLVRYGYRASSAAMATAGSFASIGSLIFWSGVGWYYFDQIAAGKLVVWASAALLVSLLAATLAVFLAWTVFRERIGVRAI